MFQFFSKLPKSEFCFNCLGPQSTTAVCIIIIPKTTNTSRAQRVPRKIAANYSSVRRALVFSNICAHFYVTKTYRPPDWGCNTHTYIHVWKHIRIKPVKGNQKLIFVSPHERAHQPNTCWHTNKHYSCLSTFHTRACVCMREGYLNIWLSLQLTTIIPYYPFCQFNNHFFLFYIYSAFVVAIVVIAKDNELA